MTKPMIQVTINGKPFNKRNYTQEIRKAINEGTEKALNSEIRKLNKVFNERTRTMEKLGLTSQSSGYHSIKSMLYGDSEVSRLTGIPASKLKTIDEKIKYLHTINNSLNQSSMSVGGMKIISKQNRDTFKVLQNAYDKGGEALQGKMFDIMMSLKDKGGLNYNYKTFFSKYSSEIEELTDKALTDVESLEKFNSLVDRALGETYGAYENFSNAIDDFFGTLK